ncbi:MAG: hypothetical protein COY39_03380 [Alphaproteobacteria bacterium CG_4_10_14_0_8_um_filter_37_21]|nr:MAG: hypothetical protein COY39_03380 [Alphaproteobacteria bacterium CG_4_10_14_0_8_um_filter_37_21]
MIKKNPLKAALFMLGWSSFYVCSMTLNKFVSKETPTAIIVFYRILIALIWLSPIIIKNGGLHLLKSKISHLHIIRGILTALTTGCTYYAYRYLPLGTATAIGLAGPLFISLMAVVFLHEKLTIKKLLYIVSGYVGVLIIVKPGAVNLSSDLTLALLAAVAGNLLIAGHVILLKIVSKTDRSLTILFYNTLVPLLCWGLYILTDTTLCHFCYTVPLQDLQFLIGIGFAGLSLQFCYTKAITFEDASFVSPLEYIRIVMAIPLGFFIFNESLNFYVIIGAAVIITSTYSLLRIEKALK